MRKHGYVTIVAVLGGAALLAAACAPAAKPAPQPQTTTTQPAAQPAQPKPAEVKPAEVKPEVPKASISGIPLDSRARFGGTLLVATSAEGPTFSVWEERAGIAPYAGHPMTNMLVRHQTWGSLEDFQKQAYWNFHADLAESWEQSADGLQWIFRLREGVQFSDGVPFTCKDAKWSLDAIRTGKGLKKSPGALHFVAVKEIECADDLTLVVKLKRPKAGFIEVMGNTFNVILPAHKYADTPDDLRKKPLIGTGPFTFQEWIPGEKYTFVRRGDYWNKPFPYLDKIEVKILSLSAMVVAMRGGKLDYGYNGYFRGGQAETLIRECDRCQVWPKIMFNGFDNIVVNHQRPPWNRQEIKDAISLAIDRVKLAKVGKEGYGVAPTGGLFRPDSVWALPYERVKQIPGYDADNPEKNKERARELLRSAGYRSGELRLSLPYWTNVKASTVTVIEDLTAVGFVVAPQELETARAYTALGEGEFDVFQHSFWFQSDDPDYLLYEHFYTGADRNYGRYANPEVDRLIDEASVTLDRSERLRKVWQVQEIILREHGKMNLGYHTAAFIWAKRIEGLMPGDLGHYGQGPANRFEHVWLAE